MFVRRWCAVVVMVLMSSSRSGVAQQIPSNIDAGVFGSDVTALLKRSETFRQQCARLAEAPQVRVKIAMVLSLENGRAQTAIHRFASGAIRAEVDVLFGENYRELLAHEFEHILEQIEGVDLKHEVAEGRAWLLPGGAFETRRAFATGVQVRMESEPARTRASSGIHATR